MQNEKPSETIPTIAGAAEGMTTANLPAMPMGFDNFYYLSTVIPDTSKPYTIAYGGVNSDSYLDAILIRQDAESGNFTLAIFDPEDPEHPYLSINGSTQSGQRLRLVSPGELGFYYPASTSPSGSKKAFV